MKVELESTDEFMISCGTLCRVWKGQLGEDLIVFFVPAIAVASDSATENEQLRELIQLNGNLSYDLPSKPYQPMPLPAEKLPCSDLEIARAGYAAYGEYLGWKYQTGEPMPQFRELPENIQTAWAESVKNILQKWFADKFRPLIVQESHYFEVFTNYAGTGMSRGHSVATATKVAITAMLGAMVDPSGSATNDL